MKEYRESLVFQWNNDGFEGKTIAGNQAAKNIGLRDAMIL
jgi:hypothetical protein